MSVSKTDKSILQELGKQTAEIAALPVQEEKIRLWKSLNGLKAERPMVLIDQIPWHEMDIDDELTIKCEDEFCRNIEERMRRTLYKWKHMPVDMVVEPYIDIPITLINADLGMQRKENVSVLDEKNGVVGHYYLDQLQNEKDLQKIRIPDPRKDEEATQRDEERAHEIFDGILDVRMNGMEPCFALWDRLVELHGVEQSIIDLIDRPGFIHKMLRRATDAMKLLVDRLEERGLLCIPQSYIHCTGAFSDDLPAEGYNPDSPRAKDLWVMGMAQIFSTVSPAMHKEFEIDYAAEFYAKFGMVYYGCCEPLHHKIDIIRSLPGVRKISMSPWVDQEAGAEAISGDYVFSRKPSPAMIADGFEPAEVGKDLRETKAVCEKHGCPVEFIFKDISTVNYKPQRLFEWARIAMDTVGG